ncbi:complement C1q tumor necrosis factor-related protein 3-like [Gouania willdenowi]|uniref:Complement C1q tumor necrosis factor-related protein 3-like n=1 Tax=Gouania willdenowi TaxID=441366 RepID=A0A8C5G8Q2_GOUWI|nr:complement C1q tumor necrosis factor-related protein 3-like [Gouania willdenowi]
MRRQRREMALLLPLVLLSICCVSAATPQAESENEICFTKPGGDEPPSVLNQQKNCIHTVLRDIIDQLAKVKVEVKHLQRENEAQAAELVTIKTKATITEKQVEALRKDREVRQVAFSASLLTSGYGETGPFNTDTNLIFRNVIQNIGNTYNPQTGHFAAPVRGVYHFEFYIHAFGHSSYPSGALLMKNGQHICMAYEHQPSGRVAFSNGVTLLLEVGDVVFLRLPVNHKIYEDGNRHNTFSGHLLFTM